MDMPKKMHCGLNKWTGRYQCQEENTKNTAPYVPENLERDRLVNELIEAMDGWMMPHHIVEALDELKALVAE